MSRAELSRLHILIYECAQAVFNELGPGLDTAIYRECLHRELRLAGLHSQRQVEFPVYYRNIRTNQNLEIELVVENQVFVEIRNEETISDFHLIAMQSKLRAAGKKLGIVMSFNNLTFADGYRKVLLAAQPYRI